VQINSESLKDFLQDDEELLAELATIFVQTLPDTKARLRFSVRSLDASMLREVSHQLSSRLGYFHASELSDRAKQLEQLAIQNQFEGTGELADQLIIGLDELLRELRQLTNLPLEMQEDD
jgi:HPt (histidine-containing phosphotransfer) domain-containing protein